MCSQLTDQTTETAQTGHRDGQQSRRPRQPPRRLLFQSVLLLFTGEVCAEHGERLCRAGPVPERLSQSQVTTRATPGPDHQSKPPTALRSVSRLRLSHICVPKSTLLASATSIFRYNIQRKTPCRPDTLEDRGKHPCSESLSWSRAFPLRAVGAPDLVSSSRRSLWTPARPTTTGTNYYSHRRRRYRQRHHRRPTRPPVPRHVDVDDSGASAAILSRCAAPSGQGGDCLPVRGNCRRRVYRLVTGIWPGVARYRCSWCRTAARAAAPWRPPSRCGSVSDNGQPPVCHHFKCTGGEIVSVSGYISRLYSPFYT